MFDTKIALIVRNDLATWQRLNVVAFLATGVASAVPEMLGKPYIDANGYEYGNMLGQPMLVFEGDLSGLQKAHRKGIEQDLTIFHMYMPCFLQAMMRIIERLFWPKMQIN